MEGKEPKPLPTLPTFPTFPTFHVRDRLKRGYNRAGCNWHADETDFRRNADDADFCTTIDTIGHIV